MSVWALLVAAGAGDRLGGEGTDGERPKAFVKLGELPLLAESLRRLDESGWIDAIVVAVPAGWEEPAILLAEELVATKVVAAVTGGATRAESVRAALAEVPEDALVVIVHDAARPLVSEAVLERVLAPLLSPLAEGCGTCVFWDAGYGAKMPDMDFLVAAALLTRVVSKPGGNRLCLDLGHKAVASEMPHPRVVFPQLPDAKAVTHSEEHLVVETSRAGEFAVGDCLYGIPWHICPTVALHAAAVVVRGGQAVERWSVAARARKFTL